MLRRRPLTALVLPALAALVLAGAATRGSAAAFTAAPATAGGNAFTVDALRDHFSVAPGTAVQPGTSTPVASGNVDTLTLAFGTVPSARTFTSVFTITNPTGSSQTATLALTGVSQIASVAFASSGSTSATLAAGASTTLTVTTSSTVAGHGAGTLRLALSGLSWMYRDYAVTIDEAPEAPGAPTATAQAAGRISVAWGASATTTNLAGYDVYRSSGGAYSKLNGAPLAGTSYADTATADGTTYTYKIVAVSTGSPVLSSLDSPTASARADATAPSAPTGTYVDNKTVADQITGTAEAGAVVNATRNGTTYSITAAANGSYTVNVANVKGVSVAYSVTATDAAGNVSAATTVTANDTK